MKEICSKVDELQKLVENKDKCIQRSDTIIERLMSENNSLKNER